MYELSYSVSVLAYLCMHSYTYLIAHNMNLHTPCMILMSYLLAERVCAYLLVAFFCISLVTSLLNFLLDLITFSLYDKRFWPFWGVL